MFAKLKLLCWRELQKLIANSKKLVQSDTMMIEMRMLHVEGQKISFDLHVCAVCSVCFQQRNWHFSFENFPFFIAKLINDGRCAFYRFDIRLWCRRVQQRRFSEPRWMENVSIRCFLVDSVAVAAHNNRDDDVCNNKNLSERREMMMMLTDTSHSTFPISHIHFNRSALSAMYANVCDLPLLTIEKCSPRWKVLIN